MQFDDFLHTRTVSEIQKELRDRFRLRRKEQRLSQIALSEKADVSLGSLKRFESSGEISLASLMKLALALGYVEDFDQLFAQKHYRSIQDVIADAQSQQH